MTVTDSAPRQDGAILLLARILIAALFLSACIGKLTEPAGFAAYLASDGLPNTPVLAILAGLVELVGGLSILFGFKARWGALLLVAFVIVATAIAHRFWVAADPTVHMNQQIHFMKNLAIIGGLLILYAHGPGRLSVDRG
jgi:putative oxidoreductase